MFDSSFKVPVIIFIYALLYVAINNDIIVEAAKEATTTTTMVDENKGNNNNYESNTTPPDPKNVINLFPTKSNEIVMKVDFELRSMGSKTPKEDIIVKTHYVRADLTANNDGYYEFYRQQEVSNGDIYQMGFKIEKPVVDLLDTERGSGLKLNFLKDIDDNANFQITAYAFKGPTEYNQGCFSDVKDIALLGNKKISSTSEEEMDTTTSNNNNNNNNNNKYFWLECTTGIDNTETDETITTRVIPLYDEFQIEIIDAEIIEEDPIYTKTLVGKQRVMKQKTSNNNVNHNNNEKNEEKDDSNSKLQETFINYQRPIDIKYYNINSWWTRGIKENDLLALSKLQTKIPINEKSSKWLHSVLTTPIQENDNYEQKVLGSSQQNQEEQEESAAVSNLDVLVKFENRGETRDPTGTTDNKITTRGSGEPNTNNENGKQSMLRMYEAGGDVIVDLNDQSERDIYGILVSDNSAEATATVQMKLQGTINEQPLSGEWLSEIVQLSYGGATTEIISVDENMLLLSQSTMIEGEAPKKLIISYNDETATDNTEVEVTEEKKGLRGASKNDDIVASYKDDNILAEFDGEMKTTRMEYYKYDTVVENESFEISN